MIINERNREREKEESKLLYPPKKTLQTYVRVLFYKYIKNKKPKTIDILGTQIHERFCAYYYYYERERKTTTTITKSK